MSASVYQYAVDERLGDFATTALARNYFRIADNPSGILTPRFDEC
jgi:hypothetical protein